MTDQTNENKGTEENPENQEQSTQEAFRFTAENYPDVKYNLLYFIQIMISNTYTYLGFVPIPGSQEVMLKLEEAKKAIDLIDVLFNYGKSMLDEADRRDIEAAVTQLRINFVNKSSGEKTKPEGSSEQSN